MTDTSAPIPLPPSVVPKTRTERLTFFRELAHVVHLGRCTRFPFGSCHRHEEPLYFTPKDNDIATCVMHWLELIEGDIDVFGMKDRFGGDA